ncbi:TetR/AcrR family transcriptional regulator [Actinoallomurus purpureus]|uniref:TetR/AcrR family transcriptional regulator n=1 Tax=Actinoallomurus purpureus TaxID=478114 RepID=UPI0020927DB6|nr:TetR/AcrR family transcriptional regulator [Actinoallomurus purpureus]MCO6007572.1 TetR/AcrR family transcriptional regulator [Actinoallomurus purpureus]
MAKEQGKSGGRRLTAQDWVDAALTALGEGGLAAVAVEPLAKRLKATKGSFYWHFPNREALIDAVLKRWEDLNTEGVIKAVDDEPDPERRLRNLFKTVPAATDGDPVEVMLLGHVRHPQVAAALRRVTERRIDYVTQILVDFGFPPDEARRRGVLIYTSHLGQTHLMYAAPDVLPADRADRKRYLDTLLHILLHRE